MRVRELAVYPVKSTAGLAVTEVEVQPWGLAGDRRWAVIDEAGDKVVAWRRHRLLTIQANPTGAGLRLSAPGRPPIDVPFPDSADRVPVGLSRVGSAALASAEAAGWLTELLDQPVRLIWLDDPRQRPMSPQHGGRPGEPLSLADAGPVLLTSQASLAQLNEWVRERAVAEAEPVRPPLTMARFRPNVVIDGEQAFAEDGWQRLRIGEVSFRLAETCDRCVMTTIDPDSLETGREPIRTLARHRRWDGHTWFGIRLIPQSAGALRVGDQIAFE